MATTWGDFFFEQKNIFLKTWKNRRSQRLTLGEINKNLISSLFDNYPHKLSWKGEFFDFSKKYEIIKFLGVFYYYFVLDVVDNPYCKHIDSILILPDI